MTRLFDDLSCVVHVVIMFKILYDFHGSIAPFLCLSHKLLKVSPFVNVFGEVHIVDCCYDFVASFLGSEIFDFVTLFTNVFNYPLGLIIREIKLQSFTVGLFGCIKEEVHFSDDNKDSDKFLVEFLELQEGDAVIIGSFEYGNKVKQIWILVLKYLQYLVPQLIDDFKPLLTLFQNIFRNVELIPGREKLSLKNLKLYHFGLDNLFIQNQIRSVWYFLLFTNHLLGVMPSHASYDTRFKLCML